MARTTKIELAPGALAALRKLRDKKLRRELVRVIDGLTDRPETQGKELAGPLEGFRSLRAAAGRFRIVFRVQRTRVQVLTVGRRRPGSDRDVYDLAASLVDLLRKRPSED